MRRSRRCRSPMILPKGRAWGVPLGNLGLPGAGTPEPLLDPATPALPVVDARTAPLTARHAGSRSGPTISTSPSTTRRDRRRERHQGAAQRDRPSRGRPAALQAARPAGAGCEAPGPRGVPDGGPGLDRGRAPGAGHPGQAAPRLVAARRGAADLRAGERPRAQPARPLAWTAAARAGRGIRLHLRATDRRRAPRRLVQQAMGGGVLNDFYVSIHDKAGTMA